MSVAQPKRQAIRFLTEEEWASREAWMRELMDASSDGFWEWNVATGEVRFSGRWAEMLGYAPHEIEPHVRSWEKLIHPDDLAEVMRVLQLHLDGVSPYYQAEHRLKRKDGQWMWILDRGRVVERDSQGKPLRAAGAHINISSAKSIELEKEEISQGRKELLALVSHELKNPIHVLLSSVSFLKRTLEKSKARGDVDSDRMGQLFDSMFRAIQRVDSLVNDLLLSTRLEAGLPALRFDQPLATSILDKALESVDSKLKLKNLTLKREQDAISSTKRLQAEELRVVHVLVNLLENAIRFTPPCGTIRVSTHCQSSDQFVQFQVEDSGPGIPEQNWPHVFNRFWQGSTEVLSGTGIGLYISHTIIKTHRGKMQVGRSQLGGALFQFTLPIA
jgi:PAS domain S-box-containing protein